MSALQHKIRDVRVHRVSLPARPGLADATRTVSRVGFIVVRVFTDSGLEGIGITYDEVGGEATKDFVVHTLAPQLTGRSPLETEVLWQELVQSFRGVGRKGLAFLALSAVDIALWDLKGKILGLPLFRLLGGSNPRVPVYASGGWSSFSDEELVENSCQFVAQGYRAIKIRVGVERGGNPRRDAARVRKVREAIGPDVRLALDANNVWDAATAIQFANGLRDCDLYFIEEPVMADDIPGLARFRRGCDVPLATGEHEYTRYGVRDLVMHEAADIVQVDTAKTGGITETLKIAALTQAWNLRFIPHGMEHLHMHLVAAMPNAPYAECSDFFEALTDRLFIGAPKPHDGHLEIPEKPGLGLELNLPFIQDNDA